ncbi:hypothetical protein FOBRF1_009854 [Fusarium oxysporum]
MSATTFYESSNDGQTVVQYSALKPSQAPRCESVCPGGETLGPPNAFILTITIQYSIQFAQLDTSKRSCKKKSVSRERATRLNCNAQKVNLLRESDFSDYVLPIQIKFALSVRNTLQ